MSNTTARLDRLTRIVTPRARRGDSILAIQDADNPDLWTVESVGSVETYTFSELDALAGDNLLILIARPEHIPEGESHAFCELITRG